MKGKFSALLFSLALLLAPVASQAAATLLHVFDDVSEGKAPIASLVLGSDGNFYGTNSAGGPDACKCGTVFKMTPAGAVTVLHVFNGTNGAQPQGRLVQGTDGNFYGTTFLGGDKNSGTIFRITPAGAFTRLHSFAEVISFQNADGANPYAGLTPGPDGSFYGTTLQGAGGSGNVFRITPAGAFTVLHNFAYHEGALPKGGVVFGPGGDLYGTTMFYGQDALHPDGGFGTFYRLSPGTTQFTVLHIFDEPQGDRVNELIVGADGNFYVTSTYGGIGSNGTVLRITPAGAVTALHKFSGSPDGSTPQDRLLLGVDGNLYGTSEFGGDGAGVVFMTTPAGATTVLHRFNGADGAFPFAGLTRGPDGDLYGVTSLAGGAADAGTAFKVKGPAAPAGWISPPTPADDTTFNLVVGKPFSFALRASNAATVETVHIAATAAPAGSKVTSFDGNPANATFEWTPASTALGDHVVTFAANNVKTPLATPITRKVRLRVGKRKTSLSAWPEVLDTTPLTIRLRMNAVLSATDPTQPLAARWITFTTPAGKPLCSAQTDATGRARCGTVPTYLTTVLNLGYVARFTGDSGHESSSAQGPLIR